MTRNNIERLKQSARTRRIAYALILLALALPFLFAWGNNVALESAGAFAGKLLAVTLLALIARRWIAHHYPEGVQIQALLAFALVLAGWSGYVSRTAHEERVSVAGLPVSSMPSRIPGQIEPAEPQ